MRRPTASASSINAARASGCLDPRSPARRARSRSVCPSHRTQAARQVRRRRRSLRRLQGASGWPQSSRSTCAASCSRFGLWEGAVRQWGADGGRRRHRQWLADGATFIAGCDASGEDRLEVFRDGAARTLPWDTGRVVAMTAAPRGSRVAIANHRNEVLVGDLDTGELLRRRPQRRRPHREPRVVAGRRVARVPVLDRRPPLRDQAARRRDPQLDAGDAAGVPRLQPGVRSGRQVPLLPVGAHLRSGLRQRAVRAVVSARRAPVPRRAAGRRHAAVRTAATPVSPARHRRRDARCARHGRPEAGGRDPGGPRRHRRPRGALPGPGKPLWADRRG